MRWHFRVEWRASSLRWSCSSREIIYRSNSDLYGEMHSFVSKNVSNKNGIQFQILIAAEKILNRILQNRRKQSILKHRLTTMMNVTDIAQQQQKSQSTVCC